MSRPEKRSYGHPSRWVGSVLTLGLLLVTAPVAWGGGTPDPGTAPLVEDVGGVAGLPDNENQLMGILGANRGFGFGDYVSDAASGLQSTLGADAHYQFFVEVPPGQGNLTVEIFDADTGAGDVGGTEEHDQDNSTAWNTTTVYELLDPDGASVASITLTPQDCDPGTVGMQTGCNNTWSDLGIFTVVNPAPGHWQLTVFAEDLGGVQDDNNSFGVRAHDGDASSGGTEYNVYADTYVGIGQVFAPSAGPYPGFSRTNDFFPYITANCSCDSNDWDTDAQFDSDSTGGPDLDELTRFTPPRPPAGTPTSFDPVPAGLNGVWNQEVVSGFTTNTDATNYGLWNLRWITGAFNFIGYYMGDESAADPVNPPGGGAAPSGQPEAGAIRLYLPADGSRFFGERGGADDVIVAPDKPWVGHSWVLLAGEPDLAVGLTSRIEVTITVDNPSDFPIQLDAVTGGANVIDAVVPTNGGQTAYVAGSAAISGGSSTAVSEAGAGPWNLTFAPGVIAAGTTATLTYRIDVTPSALNVMGLDLTGAGAVDGTQGSFVDETCADAGGGASACSVTALATATYDVGPLCELRAPVTGAIGVAKRVSSGPVDNLDGTFTVGFELVVENFGTDALSDVQVVDDLASVFSAPAALTAVSAVMVNNGGGGMLTANGSFDGAGDTDLLVAASSSLPVGTSSLISFTATFDPNGLPGPFFNQAIASGMTPTGTISDPSDDGMDPDPDGDNNPGEDAGMPTCPSANPADECENDPTPIAVPENPSIAIVKTAGAVTDAPTPGQFDVTFSLLVSNDGNVDLTMLQVTDDLAATFPAPSSVVSSSALCTAGACGGVTLDYTGPADTTLLDAAASGLVVGASITLELTVRFDPGGAMGPFANTATASGLSPQASPVQASDNTTVTIPENASIAITKSAGVVSIAGGGLFDVAFVLVVTNTGNVDLDNVQVTEDLSLTFPAPASATASGVLCTAGSCGTITLDYTGPADTTLLDATASTLAVGASFTLEVTVTFDPGGGAGPFNNTALASGDSPLGNPVQDSDSASFSPSENPAIAVTKTAGAVMPAPAPDQFDVIFSLVVSNTGDVVLDNLQVVDDLTSSFPVGVTLISSSVLCTAGSCGTITLDYAGPVDTTLLDAAASTLPVAADFTLELSVRFQTNGTPGPYTNMALASGDSPLGTDVSDDDTADIDPPTPGVPVIGVAKQVTAGPTDNMDGTWTVSFLMSVDNLGDVDLFDVQVTDDLSLTFPVPAGVVSVTAPMAALTVGTGALVANAAYDGVGDINLLDAAGSSLDVGASGEITFDVVFDPADLVSFENTALATADSSEGPTSDSSDDGDTADPDGDGDPTEDTENDPTPIDLSVGLDIPSLDVWGLTALAILLAGLGSFVLRRRAL